MSSKDFDLRAVALKPLCARRRGRVARIAIPMALFLLAWPQPLLAGRPAHVAHPPAPCEVDTTSDFSHIRVRRHGTVRSLIFVRDSGEEAEESIVNLKKPYELIPAYARYMFASYLFQPKPQQVLIVGLGGGAMVHFLQHYDPQVQVTAVEIDPMVVQIAAEYFACRSGGNVRILTADGYEYLQTTESQYDVIYLDVFLKPTASTDSTGVPLRMKSLEFYRHIQDKLRPAGVIVFNLNRHAASDADIATTRAAFPQVYVFRPSAFNFVVVATLATERESPAALRARAQAADAGFKASFSFSEMLKHLTP